MQHVYYFTNKIFSIFWKQLLLYTCLIKPFISFNCLFIKHCAYATSTSLIFISTQSPSRLLPLSDRCTRSYIHSLNNLASNVHHLEALHKFEKLSLKETSQDYAIDAVDAVKQSNHIAKIALLTVWSYARSCCHAAE